MASAAFWFSLVLWTTTCFLLGVRGQTFEFTTTVEEYCTNSHYVSYSHPASFQVGTKTIALWDTNKSPYEKAKCLNDEYIIMHPVYSDTSSNVWDGEHFTPGHSYQMVHYDFEPCKRLATSSVFAAPNDAGCLPYWRANWDNSFGYDISNWCTDGRTLTVYFDPAMAADPAKLNYIRLYKKSRCDSIQDVTPGNDDNYLDEVLSPSSHVDGSYKMTNINREGQYCLIAWGHGFNTGQAIVAKSDTITTPDCGQSWGEVVTWGRNVQKDCSTNSILLQFQSSVDNVDWIGLYEEKYFDKMHKFWKWKNDYADYDDFNTGTITFTPIVNKGRYFMVAWGVDDDAPVAKSKKFDFPCSPPLKLKYVKVPSAGIRPTSVKIKWREKASSVPASKFHLQYRKQRSNGTWTSWKFKSKKLKQSPFRFKGLDTGVKYQVRMRGKNKGGKGPWLSSSNFIPH